MQNNNHDASMEIIPRKLDLEFNDIANNKKKNFILGNPLVTAWVATMSGVFPEGEKQFIVSVRNYVDQIKDEALLADIKDFIKQEAYHAIEHNTFNKRFMELGWDVEILEKIIRRETKKSRRKDSHAEQLATTVAMEHLTASFANWLMNREDLLEQVHPDVARIFVWHAIEETEHKAVAFDVYQQCVGDKKLLNRTLRIRGFLFSVLSHGMTLGLVIKNKQMPTWAHIKEFFTILHGKNGLYKFIKPDMKDFYRDDFHPWDHNNKALAESWIKRLELPDTK